MQRTGRRGGLAVIVLGGVAAGALLAGCNGNGADNSVAGQKAAPPPIQSNPNIPEDVRGKVSAAAQQAATQQQQQGNEMGEYYRKQMEGQKK